METKNEVIEPTKVEDTPTKTEEPAATIKETTPEPVKTNVEPTAEETKTEEVKSKEPATKVADDTTGIDTSEEMKESEKKAAEEVKQPATDEALKPHVDVLGALAHTNTILPPSMIDRAVQDALAHEASVPSHYD